jgi:hypothetical protein
VPGRPSYAASVPVASCACDSFTGRDLAFIVTGTEGSYRTSPSLALDGIPTCSWITVVIHDPLAVRLRTPTQSELNYWRLAMTTNFVSIAIGAYCRGSTEPMTQHWLGNALPRWHYRCERSPWSNRQRAPESESSQTHVIYDIDMTSHLRI